MWDRNSIHEAREFFPCVPSLADPKLVCTVALGRWRRVSSNNMFLFGVAFLSYSPGSRQQDRGGIGC